VQTPQEENQILESLVADLRLVAARYPADHRLQQLIAKLREESRSFVELWESAQLSTPVDTGRRKVIAHPLVGEIQVDCDTLVVSGSDIRIMVYSAEPEIGDYERLRAIIETLSAQFELSHENIALLTRTSVEDIQAFLADPATAPWEFKFHLAVRAYYLFHAVLNATADGAR
jgi:hypothetical protein